MNDFMTKMTMYGADVPAALNRLLDDAQLYERCVTAFTQDAGFAALQKAIADADYNEAFVQAHTLKGVAANLSLTPLLLAVSDLVEALRAQNYSALDTQCAAVLAQQQSLAALLCA